MTLSHEFIFVFILYLIGAILPKKILPKVQAPKRQKGKDGWLYRGGIVYRSVLNFLDTATMFYVLYNRNYN